MHALKQTNTDNSFYFMIFILALNLQVFLQVTTDLVNIKLSCAMVTLTTYIVCSDVQYIGFNQTLNCHIQEQRTVVCVN